jgi:hypothetical protein
MREPRTSTTVRVSVATRRLVRHIAAEENASQQDVLRRAVDLYSRQRFLQDVNAAYASLREDPAAWDAFRSEASSWDTTLTDGGPEIPSRPHRRRRP